MHHGIHCKRGGLQTEDSTSCKNSCSSVNTSHCGSGVVGVSLRGQRVPKRRGGLIPQYGYPPFETSVSSPKPPYCLESVRAYFTAKPAPALVPFTVAAAEDE